MDAVRLGAQGRAVNPLDLLAWVGAVGGAIVIAALAATVVIGVIKGAMREPARRKESATPIVKSHGWPGDKSS